MTFWHENELETAILCLNISQNTNGIIFSIEYFVSLLYFEWYKFPKNKFKRKFNFKHNLPFELEFEIALVLFNIFGFSPRL